MKAVVQNSQLGEICSPICAAHMQQRAVSGLGREHVAFPSWSWLAQLDLFKSTTDTLQAISIFFFCPLLKHSPPQKAPCPSLHLALSSSSLSCNLPPKKNPLCSLLDTTPLAWSHHSWAKKVCAAAGHSHPSSFCRKAMRESLSRRAVCDCPLLPGSRADSALTILVGCQQRPKMDWQRAEKQDVSVNQKPNSFLQLKQDSSGLSVAF